MKVRNLKGAMVAVAMTLFWSACGGGGGSDSTSGGLTTGTEIASQVALVDAQDVAPASLSAPISKAFSAFLSKAAPTSGAYVTDPLNMWVDDDSMKALDLINEILCSFDQTAYAEMVDQGDYNAIISVTDCQSSSTDKSSDSGNQSSTETEELETWTVNSSLVDGVQIVKAWINMSEDMGPGGDELKMMIHAKATITEGISAANPFGVFRIDLEMMDVSETTVYSSGYLESLNNDDGLVELQFSMTGTNQFPVNESVHVLMNADSSSGNASAQHQFGEYESGSFDVAFNDQLYLASEREGESRCLDRKNFDSYVFRYGVYKADGSRLALENPGFSIKYEGNGQTYWGFASYYGIWLPNEVSLVSGLSLIKADGSGSGATYTTVVADGKLVKHTKDSAVLGDFLNDTLYYWNNGNYKVEWDGTNFTITGQEQCNENGCQQSDASGTVAVEAGQWLNFWKDGLGGIAMEVPGGGLSSATAVHVDKAVLASKEDLNGTVMTLYCYMNCLPANLTNDQLNGNPFLDESNDVESPYVYTIDPSDMTLRYGGEPVVPVTGTEAFNWGVQSGAMITDTSALASPWEIWGQSTYYTWETGTSNWNKFSGLIDSNGSQVVFDPPYKLSYTHATDGKKYMLDYAGFGELHGIPYQQVEGTNMWMPLLTIPDGSEVTAEGSTYYVRALEGAQKMQDLDVSACGTLSSTPLTAPDSDYIDPAIGNKPVVTADPAVIKGEVQ